jgi:uncharacterized protein (DUF488 family)
MKTFTIGFTQKGAERFFSLLGNSEISTLIDVRLNNVSQLAGFAKRDDLKFFLNRICNIAYIHEPDLAPTKEILDAYKKKNMPWSEYEERFLDLMSKRNIERTAKDLPLDRGCLLCSEHKPHFCHRRLVVEYVNSTTDLKLQVKHLF